MADFGSPVAQNVDVNPTRGLTTISDILKLKSQQLGLQGQAAEVQQQQQTASQRAGIAQFMSNFDPTQHVGSDGTLDLNGVIGDPKLRQAAGDQFPDLVQKLIGVKQNQLAAKQQLAGLNNTLRDQFSDVIGSLRTDPDVVEDNDKGRAKVDQAMGDFAESGGEDAARIASIYGQVVKHVPKGKLSQTLSNFQLQAMDASTQAGRQAPTYASTGAELTQTNPQAAGGAPQGNLKVTLPPGASLVKDAFGHQFILNPQTNTVSPVGTGRGPGQSGPAFTQPVPQQADIEKQIETTRTADADYGVNRHINDQILRLSKSTDTGPGTDVWHHALGAIAGPLGANNVADYQTIGAYLDRQAALSARQMGLPDTNAGLATAASLSGTTGYQPKALQTKARLTDALVEGAHQYREGLDRIIGTGPNQDLSRFQQYRAAWAQNFDPNVFRLENAVKRQDGDEIQELKKELGPKGLQALRQKRLNLIQLANGQIPNG